MLIYQLIIPGTMKNPEKPVEVADLEAVAHFEEDLVLFIDRGDESIPTTLCVQANFDTLQFGPAQPMSVYLGFYPYESIEDPDTRIAHRNRILEEMSPEVIEAMLKDFNQQQMLKFEKPAYLSDPDWHPGVGMV
jgi:hypothetical protein